MDVTPDLVLVGPLIDAQAGCEAVLSSLPYWPSAGESRLVYARDSAHLPTFALARGTRIVAFITLQEDGPKAWEVHCFAVHADYRHQGLGRQLLEHVERWLAAQGVAILQVTTLATEPPDAGPASTRGFYVHLGYRALEAMPAIPGAPPPCIQLLKWLDAPREAVFREPAAPGSR